MTKKNKSLEVLALMFPSVLISNGKNFDVDFEGYRNLKLKEKEYLSDQNFFIMHAVTQDGFFLEYASDRLKDNWIIVNRAMMKMNGYDPKLMQFASSRVRNIILPRPSG